MLFDLDKIGQLLKAARVEKGLTLEDVSARALHQEVDNSRPSNRGDWQNLPHVTYVKGYVTQYASFLQVLDLVKPELTPKESPDSLKEGRKERAVPRQGTPLHRRDLRKKIIGGAVMAGILVAFLVFLNVQRPGDVWPGLRTRRRSTRNRRPWLTGRRSLTAGRLRGRRMRRLRTIVSQSRGPTGRRSPPIRRHRGRRMRRLRAIIRRSRGRTSQRMLTTGARRRSSLTLRSS